MTSSRRVYCEGCGRFEVRQAFDVDEVRYTDWPILVQVAVMLALIIGIALTTAAA